MADENEPLVLTSFKPSIVRPNSVITIIGNNTNSSVIFKEYGKYFENKNQLKMILDNLKENQALVIDETCPRNKLNNMLYIYTTQ